MLLKIETYITCFQTERMLHIYLPKNYASGEQRYPVIYMYDGHNLFTDKDATFGKCWGMKEYLDTEKQDVIIVGIECNHEGNQRLEEFSPYDFLDQRVGTVNGRGNQFMEWVIHELKPWIDENFRTKKGRKYTGVAGSSMGGLMSIYSILHHNDIFSFAACLSPFINYVIPAIKKELQCSLQKNTKIYISWGSDEFATKTQLATISAQHMMILQHLIEQEISIYPNLVIQGEHNEASWRKELSTIFPYLMKEMS